MEGSGNKFLIYIRNDPVATFTWGGAYAHTCGVIKGFLKNGYGVTFAGYIPLPDLPGVKEIRLSVPRVPGAFFKRLLSSFRDLSEVAGIVQETPDFIYFRLCLNDIFPLRLSSRLKLPLVMEYNGSEVWIARRWSRSRNALFFVSKLVEDVMLKKSHAIVTVSRALKEELLRRGVEEERVLVNPNGFDEDLFKGGVDVESVRKRWGIPQDKLVVGHVSSFAPFHGAHVLAKSADILLRRKKKEDVFFLFVGDGRERKRVEGMLESIKSNVIFTGSVSPEESAQLMMASDILVASNVIIGKGEFFGSPTKLFEYMAAGKAVIASNIGQMKEIINHGENGILVQSGDADELAGWILLLAEDEEKRRRLGEKAKEDAFQNFTWTAHVRRTINFLKSKSIL